MKLHKLIKLLSQNIYGVNFQIGGIFIDIMIIYIHKIIKLRTFVNIDIIIHRELDYIFPYYLIQFLINNQRPY